MPVTKRATHSITPRHYRLSIFFLSVCLALVMHSGARAADEKHGFTVREAHTRLLDGVYQLYGQIDHVLSPPVQEALENGLPLTIEIQVEVLRDYWGVWDHAVASLSQRYQIQYHALSRQYLVKNLNSGAQRTHSSEASALAALGAISELPILDQRLLATDEYYSARVRSRLDIEALPTPLRLTAYLDKRWRQSSDWYTWPLQP